MPEEGGIEAGSQVEILSKSTGCSQSNPIDPNFLGRWFSKTTPTIENIEDRKGTPIYWISGFEFLLKDLKLKPKAA